MIFKRVCAYCGIEKILKERRRHLHCKSCGAKWRHIKVRISRARELIHRLQEITARLRLYILTGLKDEDGYRSLSNQMTMVEEEVAELSNEAQETLLSDKRPIAAAIILAMLLAAPLHAQPADNANTTSFPVLDDVVPCRDTAEWLAYQYAELLGKEYKGWEWFRVPTTTSGFKSSVDTWYEGATQCRVRLEYNWTPDSYAWTSYQVNEFDENTAILAQGSITLPFIARPDCELPFGSNSISIFPTSLTKTGNGVQNSRAHIDFQAASVNSFIVGFQVHLGGTLVAHLIGSSLTDVGSIWFTMPNISGSWPLLITAVNQAGCSTSKLTDYLIVLP